jgi:glycerol uptake facilitator-like aquaporin
MAIQIQLRLTSITARRAHGRALKTHLRRAAIAVALMVFAFVATSFLPSGVHASDARVVAPRVLCVTCAITHHLTPAATAAQRARLR